VQQTLIGGKHLGGIRVFLEGGATFRVCLSVSVCFLGELSWQMTLVLNEFWAATTTTILEITSDRIRSDGGSQVRKFSRFLFFFCRGDSNLAAWLQLRPLAMLLLPWPPLHQRTPMLLLLLLPIDVAAAGAAAVAVAAAFAAASAAVVAAAAAGVSNCY